MALFDDASLVVTPNGYKAGTLYSIKPTSGAGDMTVVRATTATRVNSAGLIESMANNVPRLDYSNGTCPSLLVEPQSTNIVLYSEQFDNASWTKTNGFGGTAPVVTANYGISPDGTQNADRIQLARTTSSNSYSEVFQQETVTSGQTYTFSVWLKSLSGTPTIGFASQGTNVTAYTATLTNDWVRYTYTATALTTSIFADLILWQSVGATSLTADFLVWGYQIEQSSYPTSYIPTTSAAVTRNADRISKTGISALIGQTEGTIFIDFDIDNILSQTINPVIFSFSGTNYIRLFTTGQIVYFESNSVSVASSVGIINNGQNKIAVNYKNNDFSIYANGVLVGSNNSGAVVAKSQIGLDYLPITIYNPSLFYNLVTLFPTKLTGAECISLTT